MAFALFRTRVAPSDGVPPLPIGHRACSEAECLSDRGLDCVYVDRRSQSCETAWCPEHVAAVDGRPYCRRHAGVIRALPTADPQTLPEVHNRAPSLLEWVAREVGPEIHAMLTAAALRGQLLQEDGARLTLIPSGHRRVRAWERAWKLFDHTGHHLTVSLDVEEAHDLEVIVRVNGVIIDRLTPPWITARRNGLQLPPDVDQAQRRAYYAQVLDSVRRNLPPSTP